MPDRDSLFTAIAKLGGVDRAEVKAQWGVDQKTQIEGEVVQFLFRNPHAFIHVMAPDKDGKMQRWAVEWGGGAALARDGNVSKDTLKPGDKVIVCQNGVVNPGDLRLPGFALSPPGATPDPGGSHADGFATVRAGLRRLLDEDTPEVYERIEQLLFTTAFEYCRENQVRTAKQLGISRNILRTQLKRFGLIGDTAADALAAADA